jgi:hypothetical protein
MANSGVSLARRVLTDQVISDFIRDSICRGSLFRSREVGGGGLLDWEWSGGVTLVGRYGLSVSVAGSHFALMMGV